MPPTKAKPLDPAVREARKRALLERFDRAEDQWGQAMRSHRMAPPDAGFASRLRAWGEAAAAEAGTGRRGPPELWEAFDTAVARLNRVAVGTDAAAVADAHAELRQPDLVLSQSEHNPLWSARLQAGASRGELAKMKGRSDLHLYAKPLLARADKVPAITVFSSDLITEIPHLGWA